MKLQPKPKTSLTKIVILYGGGSILGVGLIIGIMILLNIGPINTLIGAPTTYYSNYSQSSTGKWNKASNWVISQGKSYVIPSSPPNGKNDNANIRGASITISTANPTIKDLKLANGSTLTIDSGQTLTVYKSINLKDGKIITKESGCLLLKPTASIKGFSVNNRIQGPYQREGKDSLVFQVSGENGVAKAAVHNFSDTSKFSIERKSQNPSQQISNQLNGSLYSISQYEFFEIKKHSGTDSAKVTLFWNKNGTSSDFSQVSQFDHVKVAHYNSSTGEWESVGQSKVVGNKNTGYVTSNYISNFSPFTFGSTSSASPLPVEMLYFKAQKGQEGDVRLSWATASETNNSHFIVQKRQNRDKFKKISEKEGQGTTTERQEYRYIDQKASSNSTIYYRLKQVDHDGSFEYSNIESVEFSDAASDESLTIQSLGPNPFEEQFEANIQSSKEQKARIFLMDKKGQTVHQANMNLTAGDNQFRFNKGNTLQNGLYVFTVVTNDTKQSQKLLKR